MRERHKLTIIALMAYKNINEKKKRERKRKDNR